MLWTLFYSTGLTYFINKFKPQFHTRKLIYVDFFPIVYEAYWYFTQYFGMYLFLPVINKGIQSLNKIELRTVFMSLIFVFVVLRDYMNPKKDPFRMTNGYSSKWLLICFLAGAYLGKFKQNYYGIKKKILFLVCIFIFYYSAYLCYKLSYYSIDNVKGYYKAKVMIFLKLLFVLRINAVPMIFESFSVLIFFTHIKYNKYLAKIITFIAPLTFGIYLVHYHPKVKATILKNLFLKDSNNLPLNIIIKLVLFRGIKMFIICIIIDYLRHILFTILKIRKICIYFEKKNNLICIYLLILLRI
jgi:surface polysaccharide O-acyltransferase-like enzyme